MKTKVVILATVVLLFVITVRGGEMSTVFRSSFISGIPELQRQRDLQKGWILDTLKRIDSGQSFDRFGLESEELRFGLFILDPDEVTPSAIHAIAVLRNDSSKKYLFFGSDSDILEFHATGENGALIARTAEGRYYGGGRSRDFYRTSFLSLAPATQVVFEFNLAKLFEIPSGGPMVFTAVAKLRCLDVQERKELRSENALVTVKPKSSKVSLFDGPHLPFSVMKSATNPPARTLSTINRIDPSDPPVTEIAAPVLGLQLGANPPPTAAAAKNRRERSVPIVALDIENKSEKKTGATNKGWLAGALAASALVVLYALRKKS